MRIIYPCAVRESFYHLPPWHTPLLFPHPIRVNAKRADTQLEAGGRRSRDAARGGRGGSGVGRAWRRKKKKAGREQSVYQRWISVEKEKAGRFIWQGLTFGVYQQAAFSTKTSGGGRRWRYPRAEQGVMTERRVGEEDRR